MDSCKINGPLFHLKYAPKTEARKIDMWLPSTVCHVSLHCRGFGFTLCCEKWLPSTVCRVSFHCRGFGFTLCCEFLYSKFTIHPFSTAAAFLGYDDRSYINDKRWHVKIFDCSGALLINVRVALGLRTPVGDSPFLTPWTLCNTHAPFCSLSGILARFRRLRAPQPDG